MKIKKAFGYGLLAVIFALAFFGCGDPEGGPSGGELSDLGGEISFTVTDEDGMTKTSGYTTGDELSVSYDGTETVSYQWYKDGTAISGETGQRYTPAAPGNYTVTIRATGYNPKTSDPITVDGETLLILSGTVSITPDVDVITSTELTAIYSGEEDITISYKWYKDGVAIPDETNETYTPTEAGSYTVRVSAANYASKRSAPVTVNWPTPVAEDFTIGNLIQTTVAGITDVTITPRADRSTGTITIYYNESPALPTTVGTYTVTFDVAEATGWNAASGLHAGTLTIIDAIPYTITGGGTSFTATKNGETIEDGTGAIQAVINAIRADADGEDVAIQFGDGESDLDIGTAYAAFNNTGGEWGDTIYLLGKITSTNNTGGQGTIMVGSGVSVTSTADIANTANTSINDSKAILNYGTLTISGGTLLGFGVIQNESTGNLEIAGGTVSVTPKGPNTTGVGVRNNGGTVTISGGILKATEDNAFPRTVLNDGNSPGTVNITGGAISAILGVAVQNAGAGNGTINISGGTVTSIGNGIAVRNTAGGTLNISGTAHIISQSHTQTQATVTNQGSGMLNISGGIVDNTTIGIAVRNHGTGKITISGDAVITSKNTGKITNDENILEGTIALANSGTATDARLEITGGTISNTSTGIAVYNESTGAITISGGTISTVSGFAVENTNANAAITLGGNPAITGSIRPAAAGTLSVNDFNPGAHVYTLDYAAYTDGMIVVTGGGSFLSKFALHNQPTYSLEANSGNLVVRVPIQTPVASDYTIGNLTQAAGSVMPVTITPNTGKSTGDRTIYYEGTDGTTYEKSTTEPQTTGKYAVTFDVAAATGWNPASELSAGTLVVNFGGYIITGGGTSFTVVKGGADIDNGTGTIQEVITAIRTHANGDPASIQFGSGGTNVLNIVTASAQFNNSGGTWGAITLSGKITSANNTATEGTIMIADAVSITSTADIAVTSTGANGRAIYSNGTGAVNISGGTVSATTGVAVYSNNTGVITVSGTAGVTSANNIETSGTIYLASVGSDTTVRLTISDGTVSNTATSGTTRRAVYNNSTGTITVSGGTVEAMCNNGSGAINVLDGTVSARIINNGTGAITVSGGTISPSFSETAVYNNGTGTITVSGGTISASTADAVINSGAGTVTISSGRVSSSTRMAISNNNASGTVIISGETTTTVVTSGHPEDPIGGTIYNVGSLTITGGLVTNSVRGHAIQNNNTGTVNISGGSVSGSGRGVSNIGTGAVNISGGSVWGDDGGVYNASTGTVNISGSSVVGAIGSSSSYGVAVYNAGTGLITVSGATVRSSCMNTSYGTIYLANNGTDTAVRLKITGGSTVSNYVDYTNYVDNRMAIYNNSTGAIEISDSTVSTLNARAIYSKGAIAINNSTVSTRQSSYTAVYYDGTDTVTLLGNPTITGSIFLRIDIGATLNVTSTPAFAPDPGNKMYRIGFLLSALADGQVAVRGNTSFINNFTVINPGWHLEASGGNLVAMSDESN